MGWFQGLGAGFGAGAKGLGSAITGVAGVFGINKEEQNKRAYGALAGAQNMVLQGWLSKQIRPLLTLVILSPFLTISAMVLMIIAKIWKPLYNDTITINQAIAHIKQAFTLYGALPEPYWYVASTIIVFWFGGQYQKYGHAHKQFMASQANLGDTGVASDNNNPLQGKSKDNPQASEKSNLTPRQKAVREDFFNRQAKDK